MIEFILLGMCYYVLFLLFVFKCGGQLYGVYVVYEIWGMLDVQVGNVILLVIGLLLDVYVVVNVGNLVVGWWELMFGLGKLIDINCWFVVCVNLLGSCKGFMGLVSIDLVIGQLYCLYFLELLIEDGVNVVIDFVCVFGIDQFVCVIGNLMGGMIVLVVLLFVFGIVCSYINIFGSVQVLLFFIVICLLQCEVICFDLCWDVGQYSEDSYFELGMCMVCKFGVIIYCLVLEWDGCFGCVWLDLDQIDDDLFGLEFQVESYFEGYVCCFVCFFDFNCYLYLSCLMDWFDLVEYVDGDVLVGLVWIWVDKVLVIGVNIDILFLVQQQQQIVDGLCVGGVDVQFIGLDLLQGYDVFLVDFVCFGLVVGDFFGML